MSEGKIQLIEGESPLDAVLSILGWTQKEFSKRIGPDPSTLRRWKKGESEASLTLPQIKELDKALREKGLTIQDLPDSFAPYKVKSA